MNQFSVRFDMIARGRLRAEIGADFTVDSDAAGSNQLITMTPRTDASSGEEAIEAQAKSVTRLNVLQRAAASNSVTLVILLTAHFARSASDIGLGFRKADDFAAFLPLAALFQQLDALEAF
jgi:hypothetical protein